MQAPSFTVVLPVYNAADTIDATIASVLSQTIDDLELIAIDDGSSDGSLARLLDWAARDARLRVVSIPNGGVSKARNLGVNLGRSALVAFIDADDIWAPIKLAHHLAAHRNDPQLSASYARIAFLPQLATSLENCRTVSSIVPHGLTLVDVLGENPVCSASNFVVRREWFVMCGGFEDALSYAEDQDLVASLIARGARIAGIDEVLVGYRFSPDGLSMDLERMYAGWRLVAHRYLGAADLKSLEALYCRYLSRRTLRAGGTPVAALRYALSGLRLSASAFLRDRRRGIATISAALASFFMPAPLRRHFFA